MFVYLILEYADSNAIGDGMNDIWESKWPHLNDLDIGIFGLNKLGIRSELWGFVRLSVVRLRLSLKL